MQHTVGCKLPFFADEPVLASFSLI